MPGLLAFNPADESARLGSLFRGATIPGNPIAQALSAAFSETAVQFLMRNMDTRLVKEGGKIVIPRYIRLKCTTIPASATAGHWAVTMDDIDRYSSGGSQIGVTANTTLGCTKSDTMGGNDPGTLSPIHRVDFGAVVSPAAGANRKVIGQGTLRTAIPVAGDIFQFLFGDPDQSPISQDTGGATGKNASFVIDQCALMPGGAKRLFNNLVAGGPHSLILHLWFPGNAVTPASWEADYGVQEIAD